MTDASQVGAFDYVRFNNSTIPEESDHLPTKQPASSPSRLMSSSPPIPIPKTGSWGQRYLGAEGDGKSLDGGSNAENSSSFHSAQSSVGDLDDRVNRFGMLATSLSGALNSRTPGSQSHFFSDSGGRGGSCSGGGVTTFELRGYRGGFPEEADGSLPRSPRVSWSADEHAYSSDGREASNEDSDVGGGGKSSYTKRSPRVSWGDHDLCEQMTDGHLSSSARGSSHHSGASRPGSSAGSSIVLMRGGRRTSHGSLTDDTSLCGEAVVPARRGDLKTGSVDMGSGDLLDINTLDCEQGRTSAAASAAILHGKGPISRGSSTVSVSSNGEKGEGEGGGDKGDKLPYGSLSKYSSWASKFSPSRIVTYISNLPLSIRGRAEAWETNRAEIQMLEEVGRGQTGVVHRCQWRRLQCAAKILTSAVLRLLPLLASESEFLG